ncbi:uncharacterized protein PV06_00862 [Exophiala oligosperma]|uniref:SnoaL-like domain-containing protein n=2 Tax=Chaetothyriales TaxID=34395 RepID=A0A0D2B7P2_9EURO|nr:uncharacterized protein PV06_00862 [Exophiala oligosperma]KAJ9633365.1 hypothetical protein H2204_007082 [Knufia peltigerae]KIW48256.1 hypothetical protein PV06_00862 [Exophiala oligosperma]
MPGQFDTTIWPPTPIPASTKKLIARLFDLCDTNDSTNGVNLAEEVFTADGQFLTANGGFEGKDEISKSRSAAWDVVTYRRHIVDRVYPGDKEGNDLILTGKLETRTKDSGQGTTVVEFAARGIVRGQKLKLWHAYVGNSTKA